MQSEPLFGSLYRYGMVLVIIGLIASHAWWLHTLRPAYTGDRFSGAVVPLMLLLNHLAFAFRWSRKTTIVLQSAACLWTIFGLLYITYLSDV